MKFKNYYLNKFDNMQFNVKEKDGKFSIINI